jgi:RNA polymerase sigma factor (sigma-70 family)
MRLSFPVLIHDSILKKLKSLKLNKTGSINVNKKRIEELEELKIKIESLRDPITNTFFSYSDYNTYNKSVFRDAAKIVCRLCALTIHERCLELGFNNYDRSIFELTPTSLMDKFKESNLSNLVTQLQKMQASKEMKNHDSKIYGYKPHPFTLNQEVVSAIFRADPIIGQQAEIMMLTIFTFVTKKAFQYGLHYPVESSALDPSDFYNVGCIGYLNATFYWDPKYEISNTKSRRSKVKTSCHFPTFGWEFAMGQIILLIYSRRMVRFPNHIEEKINTIHRAMRKRKLEIMSQNQQLSDYDIDKIIAGEMQEDVKVIQNIFQVFISPNSSLSALLPSEQRILNLNSKKGESELELLDIIPDNNLIDPNAAIDHEFLARDLNKQIECLSPREKVVIKLRFGLQTKPLEWQESSAKASSNIEWKKLPIKVYNLAEVGVFFGVGIERVRQIEAKALRKLRYQVNTSPLRDHLDRYNWSYHSQDPKQNEQGAKYFEQMLNLDIIYFNKITNRNHTVPKHMEDALALFDSLRLLKPMSVKGGIQTLLSKLFFRFNGAQYFNNNFEPNYEVVWHAFANYGYNSHQTSLDLEADFKSIVYHLRCFNQDLILHTKMSEYDKKNYRVAFDYLYKNPVFLVNLL